VKVGFTALVLLSVCALAGCTFNGRLYPVAGPLFQQNPSAVFTATFHPTANIDGDVVSAVLANGETGTGRWTSVRATLPSGQDANASDPSTANMAAAWDTVEGQGYYTRNLLGAKGKYYKCTITGNQGTVLIVEMLIIQKAAVAIDNKGNTYKLVF